MNTIDTSQTSGDTVVENTADLPSKAGLNYADGNTGLGDPDLLLPLLYDELRRLAQCKISNERDGHTLQATELVHEAWLRLGAGCSRTPSWNGRRHFFCAAAEAMRRILIEKARRRGALKRGGDLRRVTYQETAVAAPERGLDANAIIDLDSKIEELAGLDARKAELVRLHVFAGLELKEIADALEIAYPTAKRDWAFARAWLTRELRDSPVKR
jgi:RNA polymerase sigma factor (TIGR02999 family)